ncbi:hypothetical protein [Chimaeribacter arupi]|uniref:hypothetical protein n=1 Tax=Chimaeribacter arupi TaxID=2060066 RepID=UPI001F4DB5EE|nr:hypothetical protein [Chimaeribacter arupi]
MSFEIISLKITVNTIDGLYGIDIPFSTGLFLLRVENSHGKSTCMNAIAYALGMEKALGLGGAKIPFPPSLTRALTNKDGKEVSVVKSYVELTIKNNKNTVAKLKRNIAGFENDNLITIDEVSSGGEQTNGSYFLHLEGDTKRERGFYFWFSKFLGWELPQVPNHNGKDTPLYPSVLFPAWFVEQKKGWSSILATIPTQFGIKESKKRALEFLLSLDVNDNILERSTIKNEIDTIGFQWKLIRHNAEIVAAKVSAIVSGIPEQPEVKFDTYKMDLILKEKDSIIAAIDYRVKLEAQLKTLNSEYVRPVDDEELQKEVVGIISSKLDEINSLELDLQKISDHKSYIAHQITSTTGRLNNLLDDKRKYEDLKKIASSTIFDNTHLNSNECPTCGAPYSDNLLDLSPQDNLMTYESSLNFIKDQIKAFEFVLEDSKNQLKFKTSEQIKTQETIAAIKVDINRLKKRDDSSLALQEDILRRKINLENSIDNITNAYAALAEIKLELNALHAKYVKLISKRKALPQSVLSAKDVEKLNLLKSGMVNRLNKYNFTSFAASLISISEDTYLPTREGYDIGFDTSASDGIRIIWGYLLSLFSVSRAYSTNHPGVVIFDEPRQQEANKVSFAELLRDAARSASSGGQIIFATSEEESVLVDALKGHNYKIVSFDKNDGKLIRKLDA